MGRRRGKREKVVTVWPPGWGEDGGVFSFYSVGIGWLYCTFCGFVQKYPGCERVLVYETSIVIIYSWRITPKWVGLVYRSMIGIVGEVT